MPLTEPQQTQVWEQWLAAEMRANYFADLCGWYHRQQKLATWATLLLSSGAAAAFVTRLADVLPAWVAPALALLAAGVSLYSLVAQNLKAALDCSDLHFRWNKLAREYEDLWNSLWAEDAAARLARLNDKRAELSKTGTAFRYSERRMRKWYDVVVQHHVRQQPV